MGVTKATQLSTKEFAAAVGVDVQAVKKAISRGRLEHALTRVGRRVFIDLDLGREYWERQARPAQPAERLEPRGNQAPVGGGGDEYEGIPPLIVSEAIEKHWKAKSAELAFRKAAGELVESSLVESRYADEVTACRSKLLGIASRIRQRITLTEEQFGLIESLIREGLEELGRDRTGDGDRES